ncbi:LCP family protein [Paenibacillus sp. ACRRX]|uniref:LCP family protein n=1 Tax=Paenibacillus sp. ACRRX TaxID=2918206 RepID=UPI001EF60528|nr:LCP family protein [Paenibacillus sp. ACRRX]MCG7406917.1 LCP family protein [Paenibacillus sp. ACRRX]
MQTEQHANTKRNTSRTTTRKKKWIRGFIWLGLVTVLVLSAFVFRKQLAVFTFDALMSGVVENKLNESYKPIEGRQEVDRKITEPFSILLLGVDQRDDEIGRADTIIYTIVRPQDNKLLFVSIPRDTYTEIVGHGSSDKINHAYAFGSVKDNRIGGPQMTIATVSKLLNRDIHHYATINFEGFKDVVDTMGGVKLPIYEDIINKAVVHDKFRIQANKPLYSGLEALNYVRYREDSDMNRTERQRIFLKAIMDRAIEMEQVGKITELMDIMGKNFTTDMKPRSIIELAKYMFQAEGAPSISSYMLHGDGKRMHNIWYYIPEEEDINYIKTLTNNWLNPNTAPTELIIPH